MFVRTKKSGQYSYLQIVESRWDDGAVRQQVIGTLGRADQLKQSGDLDRLAASIAKFADHAWWSVHTNGAKAPLSPAAGLARR